MITTPTVLILGAGASMPYGFPSGEQLVDRICHMRGNTDLIMEAAGGVSRDQYTEFVNALQHSGKSSVDAFLARRPSFWEMGKAAIAYHLIEAESRQFLLKRLESGNTDKWYNIIYDAMDCRFADFHKNKLAVITFNYDRSFEEFLFISLKHSYDDVDDATVALAVNEIPILHVHGKLCQLPWQPQGDGPNRPYFNELTPHTVAAAAKCIKIIHEAVDDTPEFKAAIEVITNSEQVFILGFGYHPDNMRRLGFPHVKVGGLKVSGTCYGMTSQQRDILLERYHHNLSPRSLGQYHHKIHEFLNSSLQWLRSV